MVPMTAKGTRPSVCSCPGGFSAVVIQPTSRLAPGQTDLIQSRGGRRDAACGWVDVSPLTQDVPVPGRGLST